MTSVQERLQLKRVPLDKWSTKEKLCLASAVACSGDQNWMSVSRSLKMLCGTNRPSDWFSQRSCAAQYGKLLENVETPKRKKRTASERDGVTPVETPGESILKKLSQERILELKKIIQEENQLYTKIREDAILITSGVADEKKLKEMWKLIEQENSLKEKEQLIHTQWLKEREEKKLEIERAWRPPYHQGSPNQSPNPNKIINVGVKIKEESEGDDVQAKPSTSPLLTSLLKSPTPAPNTSIIQTVSRASSSPTITNLLTGGSSTIMSVSGQNSFGSNSPSIFQPMPEFSSSQAISFVSEHSAPGLSVLQSAPTLTKLLDSKTSVVTLEPQPKPDPPELTADQKFDALMESDVDNVGDAKELMEVFQGLIPENIDDLEGILDDNNSIMLEDEILENVIKMNESNLLKSEEQSEDSPDPSTKSEQQEEEEQTKEIEESRTMIDDQPEIKNDQMEKKDEIFPVGDSSSNSPLTDSPDADDKIMEDEKLSTNQEPTLFDDEPIILSEDSPKEEKSEDDNYAENDYKKEAVDVQNTEKTETDNQVQEKETMDIKEELTQEDDENKVQEKEETSVEKVEMEPVEEIKMEAEEITEVKIESTEIEVKIEKRDEDIDMKVEETPIEEEDTKEEKAIPEEELFEDAKEAETEETEKKEVVEKKALCDTVVTDTDEDSMIEVIKEDKVGKTKRDYSRKKTDDLAKKEDSPVKSEDGDNKSQRKLRDRSESPAMTEDDTSEKNKRRYSSTPVIDSIPNSPASSEDRDHKAWKKSILAVHNRLSLIKFASIFLRPILEEQAQDYKNIVYKPMDLQTIKKNVENGFIRTTSEFQRDVVMMCQNAIMFNKKDTNTYMMARDMMQESVIIIESAMENCKNPKEKEDKGGSSSSSSSAGTIKRSGRKGQTRSSIVTKT